MLNYVWMGLLVLGIAVALTTDIQDISQNKYRNGENLPVTIQFDEPYDITSSKIYDIDLIISAKSFNQFYSSNITQEIIQSAQLTIDTADSKGLLYCTVADDTPEIWKQMAKVSGKEDDLTGNLLIKSFVDSLNAKGVITLEKISFVKMKDVTNSALDYAAIAVNIAIGLIGIMALWLGVMKVAEEAGLIKIIANALKPVTKFLFPEIPSDHPAIGAMIMNISANMLGLGNAATPFGLKAMEELDTLNKNKGVATNAMCTFLAINTAGLTLIPATAIAIRAASGSSDPAIIIGTSIFGAACATIVGITAAKILEKFPLKINEGSSWFKNNIKGISILLGAALLIAVLTISGAISVLFGLFDFVDAELVKNVIQIIAILAIPFIILSFITYGIFKKVKVYEVFVEGAKEGFNIAVKIIPYLVAMLIAIGIFRAGGAMDFLVDILRYGTDLIGMPAEALPMALMRPLSGSGSIGIMTEIMAVHGPDSFIGILTSTILGSTETTFYVIAIYFGAVNIRKTRHALAAGLLADAAGILGALFIVKMLFG